MRIRDRFFVLVLFSVSSVQACTVPVFRYALERWPAGSYSIRIYHMQPLDKDTQETVAWLEKQELHENANFELDIIFIKDKKDLPPYLATNSFEKAQIVVEYPESAHIDTPAWTGSLDLNTAKRILDSPVRQQIVSQIVKKNASAVWLLVKSGIMDHDKKAEKTLHKNLKRLEKELQQIAIRTLSHDAYDVNAAAQVDDELETEAPLFPLLTISRTAVQEDFFIHMLLNSENDLPLLNEPVVFALFGQGRAMPALVGKGISPENIAEMCEFLIGWCSCQVKFLNPGWDTLMTAGWYDLYDQSAIKEVTPPDLESLAGPTTEATTIALPAPVRPLSTTMPIEIARSETTDSVLQYALIVLAGIMGLILLGTVVRHMFKKRS